MAGKMASSHASSDIRSVRPFPQTSMLWQWPLVNPGMTRHPPASMTVSDGDGGISLAGPTAAIMPSTIFTDPFSMSRIPSSKVATSPLETTTAIAFLSDSGWNRELLLQPSQHPDQRQSQQKVDQGDAGKRTECIGFPGHHLEPRTKQVAQCDGRDQSGALEQSDGFIRDWRQHAAHDL